MPSRATFETLRVPVALLLVLIVTAILWSRAGSSEVDAPSPFALVAGPVDGRVLAQATPTATPDPTAAPTAVPTPVPTPAATTEPQLGPFAAEVFACESLEGSQCEDEIRRLGRDVESFVALVRFTNVRAGDVIEAVLDGPSGTMRGGPYTLTWSGTGYYYATFPTEDLEPGEYTVTATYNGEAVAATELRTRRSRESDD